MNEKSRNEELASEIIRDYECLAGNRGNFETHWAEIAQRIYPDHKDGFQNKGPGSSGEKRNQHIFDATASVALSRFGSILDSLLTPRNQTWHRLMVSNPDLAKDRDVKLYFEEVNNRLFKYRYAPKANFASQNQQNYISLGAYGSGCLFVDRLAGPEKGLRYRNIFLGEIYFAENHQGIVDQAYRYFSLTARQAKQKWGDKLPDAVKNCNSPDQDFYFIHCVKPRQDVDEYRGDFRSWPIASYYVSLEGRSVVEENGYTSFPYAISRYRQAPNEVYGRSPAMDVLPAIKTLNEEKKTILKQGHRAVDPVLLAFDDGVVDGFSLRPGAINAGGVSSDGRPLVHALPVGNVVVGKELMDDERAQINDAFLITLFQILTETNTMTATEVLERTKEKGILLAPTIGRQQSEYLGPMIERELDVLAEDRLLPKMPRALIEAKGEYQIAYDSPLSRAQRAEEGAGFARMLETVMGVVNVTQNPAPFDIFDFDSALPELAEIQGVPYRWMNSPEKIAAARAQRAQQQQVQTAIQAGPSAAALMKAQNETQKVG